MSLYFVILALIIHTNIHDMAAGDESFRRGEGQSAAAADRGG